MFLPLLSLMLNCASVLSDAESRREAEWSAMTANMIRALAAPCKHGYVHWELLRIMAACLRASSAMLTIHMLMSRWLTLSEWPLLEQLLHISDPQAFSSRPSHAGLPAFGHRCFIPQSVSLRSQCSTAQRGSEAESSLEFFRVKKKKNWVG